MRTSSRFTVNLKLWLLTFAFLANILTLGAISYWNSSILAKDLAELSNVQFPAVRNMTLMDMMHDGIRGTVYHAIVVASHSETENYAAVKAELVEFSTNMRNYVGALSKLDLPSDTRNAIAPVLLKIDAYVASSQHIVDLSLGSSLDKALKLLPSFQNDFEELERELETLGVLIEEDSHRVSVLAEKEASRSNTVSLVVVVVGLVIGFCLALFSIRDLNKNLNQATEKLAVESHEVSDKAKQLSESSQGLAEATQDQASALQQTTASIRHISSMAQRTAKGSENLERSAQLSHQAASRGQEAVTQMLSAMGRIGSSNSRINDQVESGNTKIAEISRVIGEIGEKTKVINEIVFQTKLLSFNASVEAARAGEHGKGFAVVAEEVGSLAQMSGNAAKEISDMLNGSIQRVSAIVAENKRSLDGLTAEGRAMVELGTSVAGKCGEALGEIVKQSEDVRGMVSEISTSIREQTQGIGEISKAVGLLEHSTNQNSATSIQTSKTSSGLLQQAQNLRDIVAGLRSMVVGDVESDAETPTSDGGGSEDYSPSHVSIRAQKNSFRKSA